MDTIASFLQEFFSSVNLPYAILLVVVLGYWLLVIIGALHFDSLHLDSGHFDLHHEVNIDGHVEGETGGGIGQTLAGMLHFFNVDMVPPMVLLSVYVLVLWTLGMLAHHYLDVQNEWLMLAIFVPNLAVSLFVTMAIFAPLAPFFRKLKYEGGIAHESLVGKTAVVVTGEVTEKFGQVQIETEASPIVLNARCGADEKLTKGDEVVIVAHGADGVCRVKKLDSQP